MADRNVNEQKGTRNADNDAAARQAKIRAVAMQHALSIEEKKKLRDKVLDMIIAVFDLPSEATTDPAHPNEADAQSFRECLAIFRPADLDEAVQERNIDNRCGYALCTKAVDNKKSKKVWDTSLGMFVDKTRGTWCSKACEERNEFVRMQLGLEPAWLRHESTQQVRLLSDERPSESLADLGQSRSDHIQEALALERGEPTRTGTDDIPIREKQITSIPQPPKNVPEITVGDILEGLPVHRIGYNKKGD